MVMTEKKDENNENDIGKLDIRNVQYIFSRGELQYQQVINDFAKAKYIKILTYSIASKKYQLLIKNLKKFNGSAEITFISNIPKRYCNYIGYDGGEKAKNVAKKSIKDYLEMLNPKDFRTKTSVFFNFTNHSKIVMTDNIAYVGSANFSIKCSENIESGMIIKNKGTISHLNKIFDKIRKESVYYYEGEIVEILKQLSDLRMVIKEIRIYLDGIFYADMNYTGLVGDPYNIYEDCLELEDLNKLEELTHEIEKISNRISNNNTLKHLNNCIDNNNCKEVLKLVEEQGKIYELAKFNISNFKKNYIDSYQADYILEGYSNSDSWEIAEQEVSDDANKLLKRKAKDAEKYVEELLERIDLFISQIVESENNIKNYLGEINSKINNTGFPLKLNG